MLIPKSNAETTECYERSFFSFSSKSFRVSVTRNLSFKSECLKIFAVIFTSVFPCRKQDNWSRGARDMKAGSVPFVSLCCLRICGCRTINSVF